MVKPNKAALLKRIYSVIKVKLLLWWIRHNDYDYDTLEQALKVIYYRRYLKEQKGQV